MTVKECPNCPGATDHTAADCPIKPAWSIDTDGILRNAKGEWVAELVTWDKGKLEAMLDGEAQPQASAAQSAPCGNITLGGEVCRQLSGHDGPCGYVHVTPPEGDITITKNAAGAIVMVSRCDAFGEVLSVIATSEAAQSAPDEREAWTESKPTEPGAYWVRGNGLEADALVQVKLDDGELWCNLHMSTTEPDFGYGYSIEQLSDDFEWLGPLHFGASRQRAQSAPVVPELTDKEREDLLEFHEAVCCDAGHRVEKEGMRRLAEIGAVESVGFGKHRLTEFGVYLLSLAQPAARQEQGE